MGTVIRTQYFQPRIRRLRRFLDPHEDSNLWLEDEEVWLLRFSVWGSRVFGALSLEFRDGIFSSFVSTSRIVKVRIASL